MLNITKKIVAARDINTTKYELPEAEVIPVGTSSNEKKKLDKAKTRFTQIDEYDNIPLPGFTLYKADRKNWGSTDQTWLVIDPRGFLVRITSDNLQKILHVTGITEGLIQEKCVWARENSATALTLVPVTSSIYNEAVGNTELLEGKINIKDVQIGDTVLLQNKLTGVYMGCLSLYGPISDFSKDGTYKPSSYLRRQIIETEPGKYHYQTDIKILTVTKKTDNPWTKEQAQKYLNNSIKSGAYFTSSTNMSGKYHSYYGLILLASVHAVANPELSFVEITRQEAESLLFVPQFGNLLLEKQNGRRYLVEYPYNKNLLPTDEFLVSEINNLSSTEYITIKGKRNYYWSSNKSVAEETLDNFTKFYKIVKTVKNESYV